MGEVLWKTLNTKDREGYFANTVLDFSTNYASFRSMSDCQLYVFIKSLAQLKFICSYVSWALNIFFKLKNIIKLYINAMGTSYP